MYENCACFFFNDTATTEIYTLSLHDALPIFDLQAHPIAGWVLSHLGKLSSSLGGHAQHGDRRLRGEASAEGAGLDRKSTRLNSSHANISYAVFCLKKK